MKTIYNFLLCSVLSLSLMFVVQQESSATVYTLSAALDGQQEVPVNPSGAVGQILGTFDDATFTLSFTVNFIGLSGTTTAAHFHGPAPIGVNAPVAIGFVGFPVGVTSGTYSNSYVLTPIQASELIAGLWYVNVHTNLFPGGEIRAQLQEGNFFIGQAPMSGVQEVPANASNALGEVYWTFDPFTNALQFRVMFTGLTGTTTAAHFHGPATPGVNAPVQIGFTGFPVGVTSGTYSNTFILTPAQATDFQSGLWYANIHTTAFAGGEIRGQMQEGTLPVELSSFTANILKNSITLKWSTMTEANNSGFEVERKLSSSTEWSKVGFVSGNNNSNQLRNYTFAEKIGTGSYNYRLKQIDFNGNLEYFNLSGEVIVGFPNSFTISQNYPNPFNPTTKIDYELPHDGKVNITLYDISGKEVSSLVNEVKTAGYYTVQLNAGNLSSGTYFYKIFAQGGNENFTSTKKLTIVK